MTETERHITDLYIQFKNGYEQAFSELYCILFDDLVHYGSRIGGSLELVEDAIQDIFLKLYQKKIVLEDITRLRAFLFRSLKNAIYNQLLRNSKSSSLNDVDLAFVLNYTIDESLFLNKYNVAEDVDAILKSLSERQKEIIYLRFIHDMSYEEIAEIMEMNIQSARNLVARGIEKLRKVTPYPIIIFVL